MEIRDFVVAKIDKLRAEHKWSVYRLAKATGLNAQTIHNWSGAKSLPTIENISAVCDAFGISIIDFFSDDDVIKVTPKLKKLYDDWCALNDDEKRSLESIIKNYLNK